MANCPDQRVRQEWIQRMIDQDGEYPDGGGREAWLRLAEAVGLSREQVISEELVLPGVRFAVDAYVNFARRASWREAASSSLTELLRHRFISHDLIHGHNTTHGLMIKAMNISVLV